jgi:glycosyltransferase involved in cell wall biosynthesis
MGGTTRRRGRVTTIRRIACCGWVDPDAGSMPSSNYLLLEELTRRGVGVDFYANSAYQPSPAGLPEGRFNYRGFEPPPGARLVDSLPKAGSWALKRVIPPLVDLPWRRAFESAAQRSHETSPYDAIVALGTPSQLDLEGVPTITWLQGAPSNELQAVKGLRPQITQMRGWPFYLGLVSLYRTGAMFLRRRLRSSARIIVGSDWSRNLVVRDGFDPERVRAVPYIIDLETFRPTQPERSIGEGRGPVILALGRLDPRKRLDLLLEAFALVHRQRPDATLRIIGRPGYAPDQLELIGRSPVRDRIRYQREIPRREVASALGEATILVQASENEDFGSSVAEALACGIGVVVGPSNGTAEYVDSTSEVFDTYKADAIAEAIVTALRAREKMTDRVRRSTRAAAERWFSRDEVADRMIEILEETVAEPPFRGVHPRI